MIDNLPPPEIQMSRELLRVRDLSLRLFCCGAASPPHTTIYGHAQPLGLYTLHRYPGHHLVCIEDSVLHNNVAIFPSCE